MVRPPRARRDTANGVRPFVSRLWGGRDAGSGKIWGQIGLQCLSRKRKQLFNR